jgi:Fur family peroxide stress response transcriptional regulator
MRACAIWRSPGRRITPQRDRRSAAARAEPDPPSPDAGAPSPAAPHLPAISRPAYRNAPQFNDAGLISSLHRAGTLRYDANVDEHHHFVCDRCGAVFDVDLDRARHRLDRPRSSLKGSVAHRCDLQLRGRRARCGRAA